VTGQCGTTRRTALVRLEASKEPSWSQRDHTKPQTDKESSQALANLNDSSLSGAGSGAKRSQAESKPELQLEPS